MKIISTNIGQRIPFEWNGKTEYTGINKRPVNQPISLGKSDVLDDVVVEREVHAGPTKACYLYSLDHYVYWQALYPNLKWHNGMFGENLTVEGLDETNLFIGNIYQIGNAIIRITEPRQPCYKFGHHIGDQGIIKKFINTTFSGSYIGVEEEGVIQSGDNFELLEESNNHLSVAEVFGYLYSKDTSLSIKSKIEAETGLPEKLKVRLLGLR